MADRCGYRYGIWANDMGDDLIDMVILRIDIGYFVKLYSMTLLPRWPARTCRCPTAYGLMDSYHHVI